MQNHLLLQMSYSIQDFDEKNIFYLLNEIKIQQSNDSIIKIDSSGRTSKNFNNFRYQHDSFKSTQSQNL